jgi:hypothetical protein
MKRLSILVVAVAIAALSMQAFAHAEDAPAKAASTDNMKSDKTEMKSDKMEMKSDKTSTITGEVIDTGCYMSHGAKGADHASCATKCIAGGMPMGLLTDSGTLYLITMNHDNADAYNKLKDMAAKKVVVTGVTSERSGMKSIDAVAVKLADSKMEEKK